MSIEFATPPRQPSQGPRPLYLSVLWEAAANIVANNSAGLSAFEGGFCACLSSRSMLSIIRKLTAPQRSFQPRTIASPGDPSRGLAEGEFQVQQFAFVFHLRSTIVFYFVFFFQLSFLVYQFTNIHYLSYITAFYILKLGQLNNLILLGPGLHQVSSILKLYFALKTPFFKFLIFRSFLWASLSFILAVHSSQSLECHAFHAMK